MKKLFLLILCFCLESFLFAGEKIESILKSLDELMEFTEDVEAHVRVTQQKEGQGTKIIEMSYYRNDVGHSFLIVMNSPDYEKGNGYLRVGDHFWMYRKNTRTFQHINRDENIGGTGAHGDDFEQKKLVEMYQPARDANGNEKISEEMLGKVPVYKFEVLAKVNDVDYPVKKYWTRRDNNLLLKEESYSTSGTHMETAYFLKYSKVKGRYVATRHMYIDEFEKGNKTIVEISDLKSQKLDQTIFTKAYLENLSL